MKSLLLELLSNWGMCVRVCIKELCVCKMLDNNRGFLWVCITSVCVCVCVEMVDKRVLCGDVCFETVYELCVR